jgi:hypothetical protein
VIFLSSVEAEGSVTIDIAKNGYVFTGVPVDVEVYKYKYKDTETYVDVSAYQIGGESGVKDSTGIVLRFDIGVPDLDIADISITDGTGSVIVGSLAKANVSGTVWTIWLDSVEAEGTVTVDISKKGFVFTGVPADVVVYKYEETQTYYYVTVTDGSASPSYGVTGTEVELTPDTPPAGYHFKNWIVLSGGVTIKDNKFVIGTSDVKICVAWEVSIYNVTVNGGTASSSSGVMGRTVTLTPGQAPEGMKLDYWSISGEGATISGNMLKIGTSDVTAEAVWKDARVFAEFIGAVQNEGESDIEDSTGIILTFDTPVVLTAEDIIIVNESGEVSIVSVEKYNTDGKEWLITITVTTPGSVTVGINEIEGYVITGGPFTVEVYKDARSYFMILLGEIDSEKGSIYWSTDNWKTRNELKGTAKILEGADLKLEAVGTDGWEFSAWTGDGDESSVNGISMTMDANLVIGATFAQSSLAGGNDSTMWFLIALFAVAIAFFVLLAVFKKRKTGEGL